MTGAKQTRAQRSVQRRRAFHQERIDSAPNAGARLWAACAWLAGEARRGGTERLAAAAEAVRGLADLDVDQLHTVAAVIGEWRKESPR